MEPKTEKIIVPAREGRAVRVTAGRGVRVIDVEGGQVGDLFAFAAEDVREHLSASHTRSVTSRLFPEIGGQFVTNRRRPILTLVEDTSPGRHDLLIAACDPARYAALGAPGHASCAVNLDQALAGLGLSIEVTPQPVNVFMHVPVTDSGRLDWLPAETRAGDAITFEAAMDCVVALSACPQDLVDINRNGPTALAIELL
ncbi:MAG TPA: urea carboxylase-associated family protein [Streptomyces sp.]|jgi:Uncharacterized conserved protein